MPDDLIVDWCQRYLGSPAVAQFFGVERLSAVHGVRLADGREVVLKARGAHPGQAACTLVHEAVWRAGIPCPEPIAGPWPLAGGADRTPARGDGAGLADARTLAVNAESWEGDGVAGLGDLDPAGWGRLLHRIVAAAPPVAALPGLGSMLPWLGWDHDDPQRTWPPALSDRWDPHRLDDQMDPLIHEVAHRSRARLLRPDVATLPLVAGHGDFEAQNCRWVTDPGGRQRLVVHDWDSVVARPDAVIAGHSALTFVSVGEPEVSTLEQNDEFLAAYAEARGLPWSELEWQVAHAAGVWVGAYNAAFEHLKGGPGAATAGLHDQAAERLRRAGA